MLYVVLYLAAIVAANLTTTMFGPTWSIVNAFLFIGLDLTSRDSLHEAWKQDRLILRMTLLIGAGSALSYAINRNAGPIAVASFVAFAAAGVTDAIVYHLLGDRIRLIRINGSNIASAAVDSVLFPTIAFGGLMPLITLGQFAAKVLGGWLWSLILLAWERRFVVQEAHNEM